MNKIINSGLCVALAIFIGRISGFFREIFIANSFGVTAFADYAVFLLTIPEFIITVLVSGVAGSVLIPTMKRLNTQQGYFLYLQVSAIVIAIFSCVSLLIYFYPAVLVQLLAPGFTLEEIIILSEFIKITIWILPMSAFSGIIIAYLQNLEIFFLPALGTLIFNLIILFAGKTFFTVNNMTNLHQLSWIILSAGCIRLLSLFLLRPGLKNFDFKSYKWLLNIALLKKYVEILASLGISLFIPIIINAFASCFGIGLIASFNYANKLIQFPVGVFLSVFSIVLLPKISELMALEQEKNVEEILTIATLIISVLSIIIVIGMEIITPFLVTNVYGRGNINYAQQLVIIDLVKLGIYSIPAIGLSNLFSVYLNAKLNTRDNLLINTGGLFYLLLSSFFIAKYFSYFELMLNMTIGYWIIAALQYGFLLKKYQLRISLKGVKFLYP